MVRLLTYSNQVDIEGPVATTSVHMRTCWDSNPSLHRGVIYALSSLDRGRRAGDDLAHGQA